MSGKKGIRNIPGMKHRRKGGLNQTQPDHFDRSHPDTLANLIDKWQQHLTERNYSKRTLEAHQWALSTFLTWTDQRSLQTPEQITKPILESFQSWLHRYRKPNGKPLAVGTQRYRLGAIQRFFAHLCKNNHLLANPAADLELPRKQPRSLPKGLNQQELQNLLNQPDTRDPLGIRDRAILETFYATGARRTELTNLDLTDLDPNAQTLHIRKGKGQKDRLIPIGKRALYWLEQYLEQTRPKLLLSIKEQALFLSGYGERISPGYLGNWVSKTLKQADISKTGSCHLLRHTCATHMLEGGADIRLIQQLLGHARLDTTSIYTEVTITHLQSVYQSTHPSATDKNPRDKPPNHC